VQLLVNEQYVDNKQAQHSS